MKKLLSLFLCFLLVSSPALATNQYLCGTAPSWAGSYWVSTTGAQGACTGGTTPVTTDVAVLNSASGNPTMGASATTAALTMTGYTGTLAMGAYNISTAGAIALGGTITATTGAITPTASDTITSNSVTIPNLNLNVSGGSFALVGALSVSNLLKITYSTTFTGAYNISAANFDFDYLLNGGSYTLTVPTGQALAVSNSLILVGEVVGSEAYTTTIQSSTTTPFLFNYTGTLANQHVDGVVIKYANATGSTYPIQDWFTTSSQLTSTTNIYPENPSMFPAQSTVTNSTSYANGAYTGNYTCAAVGSTNSISGLTVTGGTFTVN